jgi:hypothetical protein
MIGYYASDVFTEALAGLPGYIEVDFLRGTTSGNAASESLQGAVALYSRDALPELCRKHSVDLEQVACLFVRYGVDKVYGQHFTVTVEDVRGRRSVVKYHGVTGRRVRRRR